MIHTIVLSLIGIASTASATSGFVDSDHQHEWVEILSEPEARVQFDANYRGDHTWEGVSYPVVLVRYLFSSSEKPSGDIDVAIARDFRIAINCESSTFAGLDIMELNQTTGESEILLAPSIEFHSIYEQNEARVAPLFRFVCGSEWSLKGTQ